VDGALLGHALTQDGVPSTDLIPPWWTGGQPAKLVRSQRTEYC